MEVFAIVLAIGILFFLLETAPVSLDEIKLMAASAEDFSVFRLPAAPGDPRAIFRVSGYSSLGLYHCTYAAMIIETPEGYVVSEEITANVGLFRTRALRGDFLNDRLMRWGRHARYKDVPLVPDEEAAMLLKNLLSMARTLVARTQGVTSIIAPSQIRP